MEITFYHLAKALQGVDGKSFDHEEIMNHLNTSKRLAFQDVDTYRQVKSDLMHNVKVHDELKNDSYKKIENFLISLRDYYGERSWTYNTILRATSMVTKEKKYITVQRRKSKSVPPAFDKFMRAERTENRDRIRQDIINYVKKSNSAPILQLKRLIQENWSKIEESNYDIITLTNGTTTILQWHSFNVNDIVSIVFCPDSVVDSDLSKLGRYLHVKNRYSSNDDLLYITLDNCEIYDCGGEHLEIPDKDGKVREIYRMFPWIQVISKKVHKFLDLVARRMEGNYTYKHREWLKNLVSHNWQMEKYIIGADMTKYSDTLDRSFIMSVLEICGVPGKVVQLLDIVYGKDIYDATVTTIWKDSDATYQGQYGDFPMITICNLVLQSYIYYKSGQPLMPGYNAAVGDDTGMIFDKYDPNLMDLMLETYAAVGVNINRDKTGELVNGKGKIDFVKLEVDNLGIIEFFNMRAFNNKSIDNVCRDVFDSMTLSDDEKHDIFEAMFGKKAADRLMDLSVINGGINWRPIERRDLAIYVAKKQKIMRLQNYNPDETLLCLKEIKRYLNEEYDGGGHCLWETPLVAYLDGNLDYLIEHNSDEEIDDMIIKKITNQMMVGNISGDTVLIKNWLGQDPIYLKEQWDNMKHGHKYDDVAASIWEDIASYESFAAIRVQQEREKGNRVSYMKPVIDGIYDTIEESGIPDYLFYENKPVDKSDDYNRVMLEYKAERNTRIILDRCKGVLRLSWEEYFGVNFRYAYIKKGDYEYKRRLYGVSYHSIYDPISEEEFNEYILPLTKDLNLTYADMLESFQAVSINIFLSKDPLQHLGI